MSYGIKNISVDENNKGFTISSKLAGVGSIFFANGSEYAIQDDLRNGIGIFLIDVDETISSGDMTITIPDDILTNTDDNFELDSNNDITPKV